MWKQIFSLETPHCLLTFYIADITSVWWTNWGGLTELELKGPPAPGFRRQEIASSLIIIHNWITYLSSRIQRKFPSGSSESCLRVWRCFSSVLPPTVGNGWATVKVGTANQSFHLLPASGALFLADLKSKSLHGKTQGVCFTYYKIHLQLHLASPRRTPCYVCLRHVPTRHALV